MTRTPSSLTHAEVRTILTALDLAADWKRDRAETCADCPDQSCSACQLRLRDAHTYDQLAAQILHAEQATRAARHQPGPASSPTPPLRARPAAGEGGGPVTTHGKTPDEPGTRRQADGPHVPAQRPEDRGHARDCRTPMTSRSPTTPTAGHQAVPSTRSWSTSSAAGSPAGHRRSPSSWKPDAPANQNPTWKPNHDPDPEVTAMTLTINDTTMTSDQTAHTARHAPEPERLGSVLAARPDPGPQHRHHRDDPGRHRRRTGPPRGPPALAAHPELGRRTRPDRTRRDRPGLPAARRHRAASRSKPAGSPTARQPIEQHGTASRPAELARITKRQRACSPEKHRMTDV